MYSPAAWAVREEQDITKCTTREVGNLVSGILETTRVHIHRYMALTLCISGGYTHIYIFIYEYSHVCI